MSSPLPNFASSYLPGTVINEKYVLEEPLGEGGMAMVWKARHVVLRTPVALKLVKPELRLGEITQRLILEAQVEAQLQHPSIVRVFDFGQTEQGDAFMIMELLQGHSLAEELAHHGVMEPEQAVRLILPLLDALAYAHEGGIIHRDLKPENIFLALRDGEALRPTIVDFGIAKLRDRQQGGRLTRNGTLLGSPAYMAPEQALGAEDVDQRADLWAIAVVLHELVSGRQMFEAPNYHAMLRAVVEDEVPPFRVQNEATDSLWPIVARALVKDRDQRIASAREFGGLLARWLLARGVTTDICGQALAQAWGNRTPATPQRAAIHVEAYPVEGRFASSERAATRRGLPVRRRSAFDGGRVGRAVAAAALAGLAMMGMATAEEAREEAQAAEAAEAAAPAKVRVPVPASTEPKVAAPARALPPPAPAPAAAQPVVRSEEPATTVPPPTDDLEQLFVAVQARHAVDSVETADAAVAAAAQPASAPRSDRTERLGLKDPY